MGKTKKKVEVQKKRDSLLDDIHKSAYAQHSTRIKIRSQTLQDDEFVDSKLTKKILLQARKQQEDLEEETGFNVSATDFPPLSAQPDETVVSDDDNNDEEEFEDKMVDIEIDPEDERAFEAFMPSDPSKRAELLDMVKDRMTEKETEFSTTLTETQYMTKELNERMVNLYKAVGKELSRYRSGKLHKAFKVIPKFVNWEQVLNLTKPEEWSAAAMYQATRIFSSNLSVKMAQRFYNLYLLPRVRDDIDECKKLNDYLYQALRKALFKPRAFFMGMIIPLVQSNRCTLREATIFGSVMAKNSIPKLDSAAAIYKLVTLPYNGSLYVFLRVLLEKKYALALKVIGAVVDHFVRFEDIKQDFPLLWHQCLLTFVQIYKNDLSSEQQTDLLRLLNVQHHKHVTPEIRKELITRSISQPDVE